MRKTKKNFVLISISESKSHLIRQFTGWHLTGVEEYVREYCCGPEVQYVICEVKSIIKGKP